MPRINQARVAELLASGSPAKVPVGESLYLVVRAPGTAYWRFQYREPGSKRQRVTGFGNASEVTLASAVKARRRFDPAAAPVVANGNVITMARGDVPALAGMPFTQALEAWLAERGAGWSTKGVVARRGLARLSLATRNVAGITQADVIAALADETARQHADKRGWLADLFAFAKVKGWRAGDNPARFDKDTLAGFDKVKKEKHHAALAYGDLPDVFAKLPNDDAGRALRFLILTAARSGEVEAMTSSQIKGNVWEYTVLKGGKPFAQRVPLSKAAKALVGKFGELPANAMLDTLKAIRSDATVHGLRATFKSWCDDNAVDDVLSEAALSHYRGDKVHRAYSRGDLLERRAALMEKWAQFATSH